MSASTSAVTIDALPYYDTDLDTVEGLRERLEAEIEQELQSIPQDEVSLASGLPEELPSLFSTSTFLQSELDRVTSNKAVKGLDSVRYQLPAPPLNAPSAAWQKAIDNAGSQLEHQSARLANLDVMGKYASNSWRVANYLVEKEIERLQTRVENVKNATEEVNRERKAKQLEIGSQLSALEARWKTLISGNIQLELANMQIEMEVDTLREREEELRTQLAQMHSSWSALVLAFVLRYPSPTTPHIVSVDVVSRKVDPTTLNVETERIILKRGAASALPKWFPTRMLGKTESWIYERSLVDCAGKELVCITRNMDLRDFLDIQEDMLICDENAPGGYAEPQEEGHVHRRTPAKSDHAAHQVGTRIDTSTFVESGFGMPFLRHRVEKFGLNRYVAGIGRSRMQLHTLLELLRDARMRKQMLAGQPPPLSALLAPAIGESFARWEETAAGFAGHGFEDVEEERFGVREHHPETPLPSRRPLFETMREMRQTAVLRASTRFNDVRSRWFGWRLRFRKPGEDAPNAPDDETQATQKNTSRRWMWEKSR